MWQQFCIAVLQSWAHLEEQQGAYQRAQELRSYSLQEQTSFVPPLQLGPDAAMDPIFTPILGQVIYCSQSSGFGARCVDCYNVG